VLLLGFRPVSLHRVILEEEKKIYPSLLVLKTKQTILKVNVGLEHQK